jgi:predicted transcriptional regulator
MTRLEQKKFEKLMAKLAADPKCRRMKKFIQHGRISTYDHALHVSRMANRILNNLEKAGFATVEGRQQMNKKGRPINIYTFDFTFAGY